MNLFGIEISLNKNGKYVKHEDCSLKHKSTEDIFNQRIEDLMSHIDQRFEDYKDFFLKNNGK